MKRYVRVILVGVVVLFIARVAYVYADATYINTFGTECITVHESMAYVVRDFLDDHRECKIVSRGAFEGAGYAHIECGDTHIVSGSHVAFDGREACERFAILDEGEKLLAVGDHLGNK